MSHFRAALRLAAASLAVTLSLATPVSAQSEQPPKPGGTLEAGTVYVALSALSWDSADWNWKHNHDTGQVYEQLFVADLTKSKRLGGKYPFYADAWIPSDAIRGELAEKWEWKQNPLRLETNLRKGVMFPDKPGVMAARELVADDVVFAYNRLEKSPKKISGYFDHLERVEATDRHTVVFTFKNYNAEWDYRFGWGYYSGIVPKEVADAGAGNWKNVNGTGPFQLAELVQGNSNTYVKNLGYFEPLEAMPDSVKELFTYNPEKAKKLLAEAGVPKGFTFKVQVCSCVPDHIDLIPLLAAYFEQVGVRIEIQTMEYGAFLSAMTSKTNAAGYLMNNGHTNPTTTIRKSFVRGQVWNPSQWNDPEYDKKMDAVYLEQDESKRQAMLKEMTREILDKAPYIWLPTPYIFTAWWPWVKNYGGELRAGAVRPGPIYARIWIDQDLKKKMGH